jgi:hypothetical protein
MGRALKLIQNTPKLSPEINSKAVSRPFSGPDPQLTIPNVSLSEGKSESASF